MKHLARIQAQFQAHVLSGSPAIDSEIGGASAEIRSARLGIYRDAYRLRLIEVLGTDYDVLRKYLGDELFDAAASDYVGAHPSTFRNVRWFGGGLAQFLRTTPRYAEHPVLAELAQFEWTLGLAFDSADSRVVRFEDVAAFLNNGGQSGPQRNILREGTYAINLAQFVVFTGERTCFYRTLA